MAGMLDKTQNHSEGDWWQYLCTMDAIESRMGHERAKPGRVKANCLEMLEVKIWQIRDAKLRDDAFGAYEELVESIEGRTAC